MSRAPSSSNAADWEDDNLARFGDYDAIVVGDRVWRSRELRDASCRLAGALGSLGVSPGDRVLVLLGNCAELIIASNAVWRSGAVVVLAFVGSPTAEIERIIKHCAPTAIVTVPDVMSRAAAAKTIPHRILVSAGDHELGNSGALRLEELVARGAPLAQSVPRAGSDLAQISYTSGTTGTPKAVMYTHGAMDALLEWRKQDEGESASVELAVLPPAAFAARVMRTRVGSKQKLVFMNDFDPGAVLSAIATHRITRLALVPTMCEALLAFPELGKYDLSSLREIMVAGATVSTSLADRLDAAVGFRPAIHYGMAELGGPVTWPGPRTKRGSVGAPAPGAALEIRDGDGNTAAPGAIGEVYAKNPWMAAGYYGEPAETAKIFREGWLRTGDLGYLDPDGELFLVGRSKDIIIQSGVNVYPQEVIEVLQRVPGVRESAVVGLPNTFLGEEVVACIVCHEGAAVTEEQIRAQCRAEMDPRKVPVHVKFLGALPRNSVGKIATQELREKLLAERATVVDTELVRSLRAAPPDRRVALMRKAVEQQLAAVLGTLPRPEGDGEIDPGATFGSLGLKSLGAVQLANRLTEVLGRPVPATATFRNPTVMSLTEHLLSQLFKGAGSRTSPELAPARRTATGASPSLAIVGVGCRLPGGTSTPAQFWQLLCEQRDTVGEVPDGRWRMDDYYDPARGTPGKTSTRKASFLDDAALFDADFFGLALEAEGIDPQHRLLLETSWEAFEDAGADPRAARADSVGVFFGISGSEYDSPDCLGRAPNMALARLCHFLNLRGPAVTVDTACSSSLVALHEAARSLRLGECDVAVVGSANVMCSPWTFVDLTQLGVLAADGRSKAFDAGGDGFGRGEGCVVLVVKRLADALSEGDRIHAVVRATAINHDGRSSSLTAPNPEAQEALIRSALALAEISPEAVQYVEAHGTGTLLGDPIEVEGLTSVFGERRGAALAIGSVKTNIGHLEAAAGLAGVLKMVLAMQERQLPASLHFKSPNPHIPWAQIPIRVQSERGPWPNPEAPLIAGVSSFGLSGTNAHVVLEEAPRDVEGPSRASDGDALVLPLSGRTSDALIAQAMRWAEALEDMDPQVSCRDLAYTASRRAHLEERIAVIGRSKAEWAARLRAFTQGKGFAIGHAAGSEPALAMVFGGQGSQWFAMGRELLRDEPVFRAAVECVAALVDPLVSWKLLDELGRDEASSRVSETQIAQPALFALQVGLYELWRSWGIEPRAVAGHSLGEITAAYVAGALTLEAAAGLVVTRGRILQKATGLGKMASVALSAAEAEKLVADFPGLEVGATNAPRGTTLSGEPKAVELALSVLRARGVEGKELRVSYAFHSAQMDELARELTAALRGLEPREPTIALISTVTGRAAPKLDAAYWGEQVRKRVRFYEATQTLIEAGYDLFIEVGAHPVLLPAIDQTFDEAGKRARLFASLRRNEPERETMLEALANLHCVGFPVDFRKQLAGAGRIVSAPGYAWQRERYWIDEAAARHTRERSGHVNHDDGSRASPPAAGAAQPVEDALDGWLYETIWKTSTPSPRADVEGPWLLLADDGGVGEALRQRLEGAGAHVVTVHAGDAYAARDATHVTLRPDDAGQIDRLLKEAFATAAPKRIVHLWSLGKPVSNDTTTERIEEAVHRGWSSALHVVQAVVRRGWDTAPKLFLVTRGAQPVRGEVTDFTQAPLWGFGASLVHELPELATTLIDVDPSDADAARLFEELTHDGREDRVALRGAERLVARLAHRVRTKSPLIVRPDRTYLVTGGLGRRGLLAALRLVQRGARQIALIDRVGVSPEMKERVAELERQGARVEVLSADVADGRALRHAFDQLAQRMPPLAGVVHAVGAPPPASVLELTDANTRGMTAPKVRGAWNLHALVADKELDFFVLFSSTASVLGSAANAHAAAADAFLDSLAHWRSKGGAPAQSINWGLADDVRGEEAELFERLLEDPGGTQVTATDFHPRQWLQLNPRAAAMRLLVDLSAKTAGRGATSAILKKLKAAPAESRTEILEDYLRRSVGKAINAPPERVTRDEPLKTLGLDSLKMISLKNLIERDLGLTLATAVLYAQPSVGKLTTWGITKLFGATETAQTPTTQARPTAAAVAPTAATPPKAVQGDVARQLQERLERLRKKGL